MSSIVVGIGGGIAAYKACHVIRAFTERGHDVTAIPTPAALKFIGAATLEALTGHPVATDVFTGVPEVRHVRVGDEADLVVVVPATADLLSRTAAGAANDMLSTTLLMATCPVLLVPAMHTQMWENPLVQNTVRTLREHGRVVMEPDSGRLTGKDSGAGRLPDPAEIVDVALELLEHADDATNTGEGAGFGGAGGKRSYSEVDLVGKRILVTAGGTREPVDPVRFLGNRSSGTQGAAIASCARQRGADVTLVLAAHELPYIPAGVQVVPVRTAVEMEQAVLSELRSETYDAVVMAAAVADFRPASPAEVKLKRADGDERAAATPADPAATATPADSAAPATLAASPAAPLELVENPDILQEIVELRASLRRPLRTVGFAAETGDAQHTPVEYGRRKLARKGCDLLMVNEVGDGKAFGQPTNAGWLLASEAVCAEAAVPAERQVPEASKRQVATRILDALGEIFLPTGELSD